MIFNGGRPEVGGVEMTTHWCWNPKLSHMCVALFQHAALCFFACLTVGFNVGTTIVNHPPYFFFRGGRFAIVNSRAQLSPQIKKTNQNHSTTIKRIKKREKRDKNQCEPKKLFIIARIYNCN